MILVDSSVWIAHLRQKELQLVKLLADNQVLMHRFVLGELACGHIKNRQRLLNLLAQIPVITVASDTDVMNQIEQYQLYGKGIGWVDAHLISATQLTKSCQLWSRDKRLHKIAVELDLAYMEES